MIPIAPALTLVKALPGWVGALALVVAVLGIHYTGYYRGAAAEGAKWADRAVAAAQQTAKVVAARERVVTRVEVKWRERIRVVREQGETIVKEVPVYVTAADNARCTLSAGWVRVHDAAATGEPPGAPADADRAPGGVEASEAAATVAENYATCHRWRTEAEGWREFYRELRAAQ